MGTFMFFSSLQGTLQNPRGMWFISGSQSGFWYTPCPWGEQKFPSIHWVLWSWSWTTCQPLSGILYCWWRKSGVHQLRLVAQLSIFRFFTSEVVQGFNHQQYAITQRWIYIYIYTGILLSLLIGVQHFRHDFSQNISHLGKLGTSSTQKMVISM